MQMLKTCSSATCSHPFAQKVVAKVDAHVRSSHVFLLIGPRVRRRRVVLNMLATWSSKMVSDVRSSFTPLQIVVSRRVQVVQMVVVHLGILHTMARAIVPNAVLQAMIFLMRRKWV